MAGMFGVEGVLFNDGAPCYFMLRDQRFHDAHSTQCSMGLSCCSHLHSRLTSPRRLGISFAALVAIARRSSKVERLAISILLPHGSTLSIWPSISGQLTTAAQSIHNARPYRHRWCHFWHPEERDVFSLGYAWNELRRRWGRTLVTALGLAAGVGLVMGIIGCLRRSVRRPEPGLSPLGSVGTDIIVTRTVAPTTSSSHHDDDDADWRSGGGGGGGGRRRLLRQRRRRLAARAPKRRRSRTTTPRSHRPRQARPGRDEVHP